MRVKSFYLVMLFVLTLSATVKAQNCDPWIVQIYQQLYGRTPSSEECNIRNYNNGSWSNYDQLVSYIKAYNSQKSAATTSSGCDPWIVQIYQQLYGRKPTAQECNIRNYNNGSWANYDQLVSYIKAYNNRNNSTPGSNSGVKADPWIVKAYKELYNREPIAFETNIQLYNGGSWNNYDELKRYIQDYNRAMQQLTRQITSVKLSNGKVLTVFGGEAVNLLDASGNILAEGGEQVKAKLLADGFALDASGKVVSPGGGNVVSPGGGNVVSPGGGNVVSPGGGNLVSITIANVVSPGGGNVVSPGGGNLTFGLGTAGLGIGSSRTIQAAGSRIVPISGGKALILRGGNTGGGTDNNGTRRR